MIMSQCLPSPMSVGISPMIRIRKTRLILSSGKRKLLESHSGPARGVRGDPAGISSVAQQNHHYRYPWECFPEDLQVATETVGLFEQVRTLVGTHVDGSDNLLHGLFVASMENDLNTPQALLLLRQAAETVIVNDNANTGAEILRLVQVLGLRV